MPLRSGLRYPGYVCCPVTHWLGSVTALPAVGLRTFGYVPRFYALPRVSSLRTTHTADFTVYYPHGYRTRVDFAVYVGLPYTLRCLHTFAVTLVYGCTPRLFTHTTHTFVTVVVTLHAGYTFARFAVYYFYTPYLVCYGWFVHILLVVAVTVHVHCRFIIYTFTFVTL